MGLPTAKGTLWLSLFLFKRSLNLNICVLNNNLECMKLTNVA